MRTGADGIVREERDQRGGDVPRREADETEAKTRAASAEGQRAHDREAEQAAQDEVRVHEPRIRALAAVIALGVVQHAEVRAEEHEDHVDGDVENDPRNRRGRKLLACAAAR
jgi:hypothetical protein